MDKSLRDETRLRIDETLDLAQRLYENPQASNFERSTWFNGIKDRCQLLRNVLGVALGSGGQAMNDPDTGTGQQLKDYLPEYDRPTADVMADKGLTEREVEAVKVALENGGLTLQHPSDPKYHGQGWHLESGNLPPDWEERIRQGKPLH